MFKLSFKQQVLTGFIVSLFFVLISAVSSYLSIKQLNEDAAWQSHTYEIINKTREVESYLLNSESALRGYLLTQKEYYLRPYNQSVNKIVPAVKDLKVLVLDSEVHINLVDSLIHYADLKIANMEEVKQINRTQGFNEALRVVMSDRGKFYKDQMLKISQDIIQSELKLLTERKRITLSSSKRTTNIVLISSVIIFGLILFLLSYIRRTFDQQKETELRILENNGELAKLSAENRHKNWLLSGAAKVNESLRGEQELEELANHIIASICNYIDAPIGAIFTYQEKLSKLVLSGTYAYSRSQKTAFKIGEGFVGQVAHEKIQKLFRDIPENYLKISSGLGNASPKFILLTPILFEKETIAVLEIGLLEEPGDATYAFLKTINENIGIAIHSLFSRIMLQDLYERTQQQAEELETQQEELRTTNEELLHKSEALQASEEELRVQQEELQQTNVELEEKALLLKEQNISINQAREAISLKAEELEISSQYKSEFLANMSHELRTPLNSILILARILKENKPNNLNEDQIKYAGVIQNAGVDLLNLINDILDLSKIESGKIDLTLEVIKPKIIERDMESLFSEVARNKQIAFKLDSDAASEIEVISDLPRLEQIIKNLLSNAFKFTPEKGKVTLSMAPASTDMLYYSKHLNAYKDVVLAIAVSDTGIGIPQEKQQAIFEAFQQADGSTSRKYGGTGLGLSISKELANLLGGEIQVKSTPGEGSTFTLFVPLQLAVKTEIQEAHIPEPRQVDPAPKKTATLTIQSHHHRILIIEDDVNFAEILKDFATERGFLPMLAHSGDIGLEMAIKELPDAIILDIMLPGIDGWTVLKRLKENTNTRHIPVHLMSAGDEKTEKAKREGAIGFLRKPVQEEDLAVIFNIFAEIPENYHLNNVLLIEDQELQSKLLTQDLIEKGIHVVQAFNAKEAFESLANSSFDCIILDLNLPDISGFELLDKIKADPKLQHIPVVINTAMELQKEQMDRIMHYSDAMVLKSKKSNDRVIDEVSLFMNKLNQGSKKESNNKPTEISLSEKALAGKKILVVDDDMRNIFALSRALEDYEMQIVIANNGKEALARLADTSGIDLVLMDIMMPEMDGYEAMRHIRNIKTLEKMPIIALTAKAMRNDREKCIEAGANDYITKPVDIDELLSMMRVWLSK